MSKTFEHVAHVVAKQLSSLLQTAVFISDSNQNVVASRQFHRQNRLDDKSHSDQALSDRYLSLPLYVYDQVGEVRIEQGVDGEMLSPKHARAFLDLLVSQLADPTFPQQQIYKNQVISNLLKGRITEESVALQQAKLLGIDLTPPRAVILVDATDVMLSMSRAIDEANPNQQRCCQAIINSIVTFFNLPDETICADLGGGQFAVLKASDSKNLSPWAGHDTATHGDSLGCSWTNLEALKRAGDALLMRLREETGTTLSVGIGRYHPGLLGLARSYQDAQVALRLGRQFDGQNRVYCLDDLGIAAFACVADERTKVDLALHLLSPLDNELELINTLKVFFSENCAPITTAKRLCIHRNTLTYRLEKITSLTGLDPRRFDEAVQIRLALLLQEFQGI
ncbi:MAG: helix-turn-helix domain-containing protein [Nodosilinea sp. WJT8-NPBG4]|nr:helix-turn-helix domain-containing protein [Nodosilinea sp. WJT8-NPBG4]